MFQVSTKQVLMEYSKETAQEKVVSDLMDDTGW